MHVTLSFYSDSFIFLKLSLFFQFMSQESICEWNVCRVSKIIINIIINELAFVCIELILEWFYVIEEGLVLILNQMQR